LFLDIAFVGQDSMHARTTEQRIAQREK
jgi:hypothetical protein